MKRPYQSVLLLVLALMLAGCGKKIAGKWIDKDNPDHSYTFNTNNNWSSTYGEAGTYILDGKSLVLNGPLGISVPGTVDRSEIALTLPGPQKVTLVKESVYVAVPRDKYAKFFGRWRTSFRVHEVLLEIKPGGIATVFGVKSAVYRVDEEKRIWPASWVPVSEGRIRLNVPGAIPENDFDRELYFELNSFNVERLFAKDLGIAPSAKALSRASAYDIQQYKKIPEFAQHLND